MGSPSNLPEVHTYTDGSCIHNPGPGGWGVVLLHPLGRKTLSGSEPNTTSSRMELTAGLQALRALSKPCILHVHSDSTYLCKGMTTWIHTWLKNNWRTGNRKKVLNQDLWLALLEAAAPHQVSWNWVAAHTGHPLNEEAHTLAYTAALKAQ